MEETINLFDDSNWIDAPEYPSGTRKKVLRDENGSITLLLKLPEGFYMDPHSHVTAEQHCILKGEYIIEGKVYHEGTYQSFKAHERHGPFESKHGALVLVIWDPQQANK
jgi:anti-sigma factor ChrR (cupin superfamily)